MRVYPLAQTQQSTCAIDWQAAREERFPRTLLTIGSGFKLQSTEASRGLDYARILNSIAELRQVNQPPARHHLCYSEASKTLIWILQMMFVESETHRKRLGSKGVVTDKVKLKSSIPSHCTPAPDCFNATNATAIAIQLNPLLLVTFLLFHAIVCIARVVGPLRTPRMEPFSNVH